MSKDATILVAVLFFFVFLNRKVFDKLIFKPFGFYIEYINFFEKFLKCKFENLSVHVENSSSQNREHKLF